MTLLPYVLLSSTRLSVTGEVLQFLYCIGLSSGSVSSSRMESEYLEDKHTGSWSTKRAEDKTLLSPVSSLRFWLIDRAMNDLWFLFLNDWYCCILLLTVRWMIFDFDFWLNDLMYFVFDRAMNYFLFWVLNHWYCCILFLSVRRMISDFEFSMHDWFWCCLRPCDKWFFILILKWLILMHFASDE